MHVTVGELMDISGSWTSFSRLLESRLFPDNDSGCWDPEMNSPSSPISLNEAFIDGKTFSRLELCVFAAFHLKDVDGVCVCVCAHRWTN